MLRISGIRLPVAHSEEDLYQAAARELRRPAGDILSLQIVRKSIDARKKPDVKFVYTIDAEVKNAKKIKLKNNIAAVKSTGYRFPKSGPKPLKNRPVIIGSGPAGLFCGLFLAKQGYRPVIFERGQDVDSRTRTVSDFWDTGRLNPESNVQFGEGGAGTFSDGKLNTSVKDPFGRNRVVLETFVAAGAPTDILYWNKPHLGTDVLTEVVKNIRKQIEDAGGEVHFNSKVTDILTENGRVTGVLINDQTIAAADVLIAAIGHSARDTFEVLHRRGIPMEQKAFAVGVRAEHSQQMINRQQYGISESDVLPAADYKVVKSLSDRRGVYSFCMCPGGYVVNASSEAGRLCVNGMSYRKRDGANANSAIVVSVSPADFDGTGPLAGVAFQRGIEAAAYQAGGGKIPVQLYGDFKEDRISSGFQSITPAMKGGYCFADLRSCLPPVIVSRLIDGMTAFEKMIPGFSAADVIFSGVETRTSSPVRILREKNFESSIRGFYPCGEGAGYAGGITSAAMDGIKTAEAIAGLYQPF